MNQTSVITIMATSSPDADGEYSCDVHSDIIFSDEEKASPGYPSVVSFVLQKLIADSETFNELVAKYMDEDETEDE